MPVALAQRVGGEVQPAFHDPGGERGFAVPAVVERCDVSGAHRDVRRLPAQLLLHAGPVRGVMEVALRRAGVTEVRPAVSRRAPGHPRDGPRTSWGRSIPRMAIAIASSRTARPTPPADDHASLRAAPERERVHGLGRASPTRSTGAPSGHGAPRRRHVARMLGPRDQRQLDRAASTGAVAAVPPASMAGLPSPSATIATGHSWTPSGPDQRRDRRIRKPPVEPRSQARPTPRDGEELREHRPGVPVHVAIGALARYRHADRQGIPVTTIVGAPAAGGDRPGRAHGRRGRTSGPPAAGPGPRRAPPRRAPAGTGRRRSPTPGTGASRRSARRCERRRPRGGGSGRARRGRVGVTAAGRCRRGARGRAPPRLATRGAGTRAAGPPGSAS